MLPREEARSLNFRFMRYVRASCGYLHRCRLPGNRNSPHSASQFHRESGRSVDRSPEAFQVRCRSHLRALGCTDNATVNAWVITISSEGVVNAAPFGFFNLLDSSLQANRGHLFRGHEDDTPKDAARDVRLAHQFVVTTYRRSRFPPKKHGPPENAEKVGEEQKRVGDAPGASPSDKGSTPVSGVIVRLPRRTKLGSSSSLILTTTMRGVSHLLSEISQMTALGADAERHTRDGCAPQNTRIEGVLRK